MTLPEVPYEEETFRLSDMFKAPATAFVRTSILVLSTLWFGSVSPAADVVLDWNAIAVDTAIANGANPSGPIAECGNRATGCL